MPRKRDHIRARTEIAALLCQLRDEKGELFIPYEHAKLMHEDQVISLFQKHHSPIPHAAPFNGPDAHWNLVHKFIGSHKFITNVNNGTGRSDRQVIDRTRKIADREAQRKLLRKPRGRRKPKAKRSPGGIGQHVDPWGKQRGIKRKIWRRA